MEIYGNEEEWKETEPMTSAFLEKLTVVDVGLLGCNAVWTCR
jgi:hypothetical protein